MINVSNNLFYFYLLRIFVTNRNKLNFTAFQKTFRKFTVFSITDVEIAFPGFDRKILVVWQDKGYIHKVRNSWYCFADRLLQEDDLCLVANKIYAPSYVSLESAFSFYHFIPEGVFRTTSVGTLKTASFDTPIGYFHYRNIKPFLFFGYRLERQAKGEMPGSYKIASPEKALIDFLYLNPQYKDEVDLDSLRFNWEAFGEAVDMERLEEYVKYIGSGSLTKRMGILLNLFHAQS